MVERREGLEPAITLKELFRQTTLKPNRVYEGPSVIDLGDFQEDIEELIDFTSSHPQRFEAARIVYLEQSGRLITNKEYIQGEKHGQVERRSSIGVMEIPGLPRVIRQDRFVAADIHSHPVDSVFSTTDLIHLFKKDDVSDCAASAILITPKRKLIALRGKSTPTWEVPEAVMDNISQDILSMAREKNRFWMRKSAKQNVRLVQNQEMFGNLVQVYDLQVFEGGVRDRYLRRMKPHDIAR